ncbi:MAG: hypothetical protein ACRC0X_07025, partial [Brevinema sp.]
ETYHQCVEKYQKVEQTLTFLENHYLTPSDQYHTIYQELNTPIPPKKISLAEFLRRPEVSLNLMRQSLEKHNIQIPQLNFLEEEQVSIAVKYQGYIQEETKRVVEIQQAEHTTIPKDFPYDRISGLRLEEIEKLSTLQPHTLGQISRIPGIRPAAVHIISLVLKFDGEKGMNKYTTEAPIWGHSSSNYQQNLE